MKPSYRTNRSPAFLEGNVAYEMPLTHSWPFDKQEFTQ